MSHPVKPIPDGYHSVTPYLIIRGAAKAIDYYKQAFGAVELLPPTRRAQGARNQIGQCGELVALACIRGARLEIVVEIRHRLNETSVRERRTAAVFQRPERLLARDGGNELQQIPLALGLGR